jgi:hypothetical protein
VTADAFPQVFEPDDGPGPDAPVPRWPHMTRDQALEVIWPEIERRVSEGETLTAVCALQERFEPDGRRTLVPRLPGTFPHRTTVYEWCDDPVIARRFARARALCVEAWQDQQLAIADDATRDWIPGERGLIFDGEHVQRSKLRIWARDQLIRRIPGHRPGDAAAANGVTKVAPPKVELIGIIPRGQEAQYANGEPIEGYSIRIDDDEDEDGDA